MLVKRIRNAHLKLKKLVSSQRGYSIPMVLLISLILVIIGAAITTTIIQVFKISKSNHVQQIAYFAAESALERSSCNIDSYIYNYGENAFDYSEYENKDVYVDKVIEKMKLDTQILKYFDVDILNDPSNQAHVNITFENGPNPPVKISVDEIQFQLTITAESTVGFGLYQSNSRRAVAVKDYIVKIPDPPFMLQGAIYSLGDIIAKSVNDDPLTPATNSTIKGDVYAFGTGLDIGNTMMQHYNGGIWADQKANLRIIGNAFSNGLIRAGSFSEGVSSIDKCSVVVDEDIIAYGVQVFGAKDYIVAQRDVYTFDDVELNGPDSYIAIKGNFFGLSKGHYNFHDASSAILNMAPRYGSSGGYEKSKIVINGGAYVNGEVFRISDGKAYHKIENAAPVWLGDEILQDTMLFPVTDSISVMTQKYQQKYKDYKSQLKGPSIIIQAQNWNNINATPEEWIDEIRTRTYTGVDALTFKSKIDGYCKFALSANNRVYITDNNEGISDIKIPDTNPTVFLPEHTNVKSDFWDKYFNQSWSDYNSIEGSGIDGIEVGLGLLKDAYFKDHVGVFASKEMPNSFTDNTLKYSHNSEGFNELYDKVEALRAKHSGGDRRHYFINFTSPLAVETQEDVSALINIDTNPKWLDANGDGFNDNYFIIMNDNPKRTLIINQPINGIIITKGKVVIEGAGKVNGAVIASGRIYNSTTHEAHSFAENDYLPRVFLQLDNSNAPALAQSIVKSEESKLRFKNGENAGVTFVGGGEVEFEGREVVLGKFFDYGIDLEGVL